MNYNQNDPIYKTIFLGFSKKYSLYSDGCYVFAVAFLLGIDPVACNEALKSVGAFKPDPTGDLCYLDHTKIRLAFPDRIEDVEKVDPYDNDKCLAAISQYSKVIVLVDYDGTNSTIFDTHFVTYIGNKQLFDSLGGKVKPTSTYPLVHSLRIVKLKPPAIVPVVGTITREQAIIDSYLALRGDISDDEKAARLANWQNLKYLIEDLIHHDGGVYTKLFYPYIQTAHDEAVTQTKAACDAAWSQKYADLQASKTTEVNDLKTKLAAALNVNFADIPWQTLLSWGWKNFWKAKKAG